MSEDETEGEDYGWIEEAPGETRIDKVRWIVANHSARKIDGYLVDATTANALAVVHDAFKEQRSRDRFETLSLPRLVEFVWNNVKPRA